MLFHLSWMVLLFCSDFSERDFGFVFHKILIILFLFYVQWNLYKCSNKSNRFHLKMESDEETATAIFVLLLVKKNKKKWKSSVLIKPWLRRRTMTPQGFDEFLGLIQDDITKTNINMRDFIPANIKLAGTIRFLATGDNYTNLQY